MDYTSFEYVYSENLSTDETDDCIFKGFIDGHPSDENKEGTVIATVSITYSGDVVVDWHHNAYRSNETVLNLIKEARTDLTNDWVKWANEKEREMEMYGWRCENERI